MRRLKSPVRSTVLVLAICGAATSAALANDTTAELKTGGLAYVQTSDIAMEEEDLFLSREEIRVDYVFRNLGKDKVESLIAFPMPDIVGGSESDIAYGDNESDNFLGFSVVQDGKEITTQLQQRVTALGIDQTERLKAAGVPFLPYSEKTAAALKNLSAADKAEWAALGLIRNDDFGGLCQLLRQGREEGGADDVCDGGRGFYAGAGDGCAFSGGGGVRGSVLIGRVFNAENKTSDGHHHRAEKFQRIQEYRWLPNHSNQASQTRDPRYPNNAKCDCQIGVA